MKFRAQTDRTAAPNFMFAENFKPAVYFLYRYITRQITGFIFSRLQNPMCSYQPSCYVPSPPPPPASISQSPLIYRQYSGSISPPCRVLFFILNTLYHGNNRHHFLHRSKKLKIGECRFFSITFVPYAIYDNGGRKPYFIFRVTFY